MNEKKTVIIQLMPFCNMKILFEICQPDFGNNLELKTTPTNGHKISIFSKIWLANLKKNLQIAKRHQLNYHCQSFLHSSLSPN